MYHTKDAYPFWITVPEDIRAILSGLQKGRVHTLCTSAGGREIPYVTYGEKPDYHRKANYSSACGAHDPKYYADRTGKRPTILILGATHGQETEGVAAIANLLSLLETGVDLRGRPVPEVTEAFDALDPRLVIVPIYNMDGRCRCQPDSMLGESPEGLRYHGQGTWKDGTLCKWPECKMIHPVKGAVDFLGAYYNDDGVNLMHDNFFAPMAPETRALMALTDAEAPDCIAGLHGGGETINLLLQPSYVPLHIRQGVYRIAAAVAAREKALGFSSYIVPVPDTVEGNPPPSFNLTSALHHICGGVSFTYESNEGLSHVSNSFSPEEILLRHYCLFASLFQTAWAEI